MIEQPAVRSHEARDRRSDEDRDRRSVEERRAQLIEAATEVIAAEGLGRATTRRITDHADLALGAFHYAFRSKDELLEAVVERIGDHLDSVLRNAVTDLHVPLQGAVEQLIAGYWEAVDRSPDLYLAAYELTVHALREQRLRELAARQHERYVTTVAELLGKVTDPTDAEQREEFARFLLATMEGLVLQWLLHGDPARADRRVILTMRCLGSLLPGASS